MFLTVSIWAVLGYLLGSIPFGFLLTRMAGTDIRQVGSGNIGATNVLRSGHKGLALATLVLDGGKGAVAVLLARQLAGPDAITAEGAAMMAGAAAFIGHCFPLWLGFRGGKGVATLLGVVLAGVPLAGLAALLAWATAALLTRYSSVAGMAAALAAPVAALALGQEVWAFILVPLALLLIVRHRDNLARLRDGRETKIGAR